ncbi:hypothetical protein N7495_008012 [Penicillium taxi]|uniref:uncharacterized protein n=1 Tax=Penicillium taxi TaxID=168475 RepID=UPI002544DCFC|nr:uncharacterized protein N7495_008012 [Penicillium taxi]KAJ5887971.1 hypothetical protein N7495_008012 [Penicillium taxi]
MDPVMNTLGEDDQMKDRILLRDNFKGAVSEPLKVLESKPETTYTSDDLASLVSLSQISVFQPFPLDEFKKFTLEPNDDDSTYHNFLEIYDRPSKSQARRDYLRAEDVIKGRGEYDIFEEHDSWQDYIHQSSSLDRPVAFHAAEFIQTESGYQRRYTK